MDIEISAHKEKMQKRRAEQLVRKGERSSFTDKNIATFCAYWRAVRRIHGVGSRALRVARQAANKRAA